VLKQAERPDDLGLWRLRFDDSQMDDYSGITIDNYNLTFNLPNTVNAKRSLQEQAQVICSGQLSSAYGGALFTCSIS
jgi:hypothetical protein